MLRLTCQAVLAFALAFLALPAARAQAPWADQRYQYRVPLTVTNTSGRDFASGEIIAATVPNSQLAGRRRGDGADLALYADGTPLPSRALMMGGSNKILFALPDAAPNGGQVTGLYLYFGAPSVSTPPPSPANLQISDFSDGALHGWKSLQRPDDANSPISDIRSAVGASGISAMAAGTGAYHHPMFFSDGMIPLADATVYTALQTNGGENEVSLVQRFNTQILTDGNGQSYLTGLDPAAVGLAVDAFGSQRILVKTPLGSPEGSDGRRHPGPATLSGGSTYIANPDNIQLIVASTRDVGASTQVSGKAWQARWPFAADAAADPTPGAFQTSANVAGGSLPPGKIAFMLYGTSVSVQWVVAAPNADAESVAAASGAIETAPDPGPTEAVIQGLVYSGYLGPDHPVDGATVTITGANDTILSTSTTDATGRYRVLLSAGASPIEIRIAAVGPDGAGAVEATLLAGHTRTVDIPLEWTTHATGTVTDINGAPVSGATVGRFLDGGPFVQTNAEGQFNLPVPSGTAVIGAHKDGTELSGPRWLTPTNDQINADFTLFAPGDGLLQGVAPTVTPATGNAAVGVTDGDLATAWTSDQANISPANPLRLSWALADAAVSQVEVHWKNPPAAWRVEMSNLITNTQGLSPRLDTRVYYEAGGSAPSETGGYTAPGAEDRHVTVVKTAAVWGVKTLSIVVTAPPASGQASLYEVRASAPAPITLSDAAAVLRIASGLRPAPGDRNAFIRWNADNSDQKLTLADAVRLARAPTEEVKDLRVFVINYIPVIEAEGGRTAGQIFNWYDPHPQTEAHRQDMELASHGFLRIHLLPQADVDEYPVFTNGFMFTDDSFMNAWRTRVFPPGGTDYQAIIRRFDLERRVAVGDIDEVWIQAPPLFGMPETIMAGANAYWCNSGPVPGRNGNRLFIFTNFNYERHTDVMIHDWGHRAESILGVKVYGGWNSQSGRTTFDRFTRYDQITPGLATAGNTHTPPNGTSGYDYANTNLVMSDADDWLNYPNLTGTRRKMNRTAWSLPRKTPNGDIDYQRNFLIWWFSRYPHVPGIAPDGKQANWWKYVADMNRYPESR